jgi:hypothetical protein
VAVGHGRLGVVVRPLAAGPWPLVRVPWLPAERRRELRNARVVGARVGGGARDEVPQDVGRLEEEVGRGAVERLARVAQARQLVLHRVGEAAHVDEAQHRGAALDGMRRQEHRADRRRIGRVAF